MVFVCEPLTRSSLDGDEAILGTEFSSTIIVSFWIMGSETFSFTPDIIFLWGRGAGAGFKLVSGCYKVF